MVQFQLSWINTAVLISPNAISQRASYRQRSIGGAFLTTGFTPANDLPTTASDTLSPSLLDNVVYQFKVTAICTANGPTDNNNGVQENIHFACLTGVLSQGTTTAQIVLNVTGLDITKARFSVKKVSDDTSVFGPVTIAKVGNSITANATGLTAGTGYYWEYDMYATVNGAEVISSSVDYLGTPCNSVDFTTDPDICNPITELTAEAMELA